MNDGDDEGGNERNERNERGNEEMEDVCWSGGVCGGWLSFAIFKG